MQILLTNDDGIHAPGLAALERELSKLGDVTIVAPAIEQSGVGHSITFLVPLTCKEVFEGDSIGWKKPSFSEMSGKAIGYNGGEFKVEVYDSYTCQTEIEWVDASRAWSEEV